MPGGRVEPGESDHQAVLREVAEETGLEIEIIGSAGRVERPAPGGAVFDIHDYLCRVQGGTPRAGSDVDDVRWCDAARFATLPVVSGLIEALTDWGCLPG